MTALAEATRSLLHVTERGPELLPLDAGEQYRFVFEMDSCIGCHSCEVACAEQNGNPVGVNWRRVGELEGGDYPHTRRFHLSMACNHCLDPACLTGCPTNAYVKLGNGIVQHHAEDCIGCGYCVWNCPYEAPVFNRERGVVTKCDMCMPRLESGGEPACVEACPTQAIRVEKVDVAAWREDHSTADAPGLPPSELTLSTTRIVLPSTLPSVVVAGDAHRVEPEDAHWPLAWLTLLTQLAFGVVASTVGLEAALRWARPVAVTREVLGPGALAAFCAGALALTASLFHLGRPASAWKALRNLKHSWLSREVALLSGFAGAAMAYAGAWRLGLPTLGLGVAAVAIGGAGIYASGKLYLVPARPVWNSARTLVAFFLTAATTGPLATLLVLDRAALPRGCPALLLATAGAAHLGQMAVYLHLIALIALTQDHHYQGTGKLLFGRFRRLFVFRVAASLIAVGLLTMAAASPTVSRGATALMTAALIFTAAGELAGRHLFYVTVVPMSIAGTFSGRR